MGRQSGQNLWPLVLFGLAIGFAAASQAWGGWGALGVILIVVVVVVLSRRLSRRGARSAIPAPRTLRLGRAPRPGEGAVTPAEDPHRIAEEAFGARTGGRFRRSRGGPRP